MPQLHRFEFARWTLALIGEVIERQLGIKLSRGALGHAMARAHGAPLRLPCRQGRSARTVDLQLKVVRVTLKAPARPVARWLM